MSEAKLLVLIKQLEADGGMALSSRPSGEPGAGKRILGRKPGYSET